MNEKSYNILAFDKTSMRVEDRDGHLHVRKTPISKAAINPYKGCEIPCWESLGLESEHVYHMYRPPEELVKAAASFAEKPLLSSHQPLTSRCHEHDKVIGTTGTQPVFEFPYLRSSLTIWDGQYIDAVRYGYQKQLSACYYYTPVMQSGTKSGQAYDGIMTNITGNHVALVTRGRAGADVAVADADSEALFSSINSEQLFLIMGAILTLQSFKSSPTEGMGAMDLIKILKEFSVTPINQYLSKIAVKIGLKDEALLFLEKDVVSLGQDPPPSALSVDADSLCSIENSIKEKMKQKYYALRKAEREVRPLVGDIQVNMDSAEEVYAFALKTLGITVKDVHPSAYATLLELAHPKQISGCEIPISSHRAAISTPCPFGSDRLRRI